MARKPKKNPFLYGQPKQRKTAHTKRFVKAVNASRTNIKDQEKAGRPAPGKGSRETVTGKIYTPKKPKKGVRSGTTGAYK